MTLFQDTQKHTVGKLTFSVWQEISEPKGKPILSQRDGMASTAKGIWCTCSAVRVFKCCNTTQAPMECPRMTKPSGCDSCNQHQQVPWRLAPMWSKNVTANLAILLVTWKHDPLKWLLVTSKGSSLVTNWIWKSSLPGLACSSSRTSATLAASWKAFRFHLTRRKVVVT